MPLKAYKAIRIYHIVHIANFQSIVNTGYLYSDAAVMQQNLKVTTIGMTKIKQRRLKKTLNCYPDLHVGDCVPFYFCPRSIMLYIFYKGNHPEVNYRGGQTNIIHLEAYLYKAINWANSTNRRWVFTDANAGSYYFNDYNNIKELGKLNWEAIYSNDWSNPEIKEAKQSEFLCEHSFNFGLIDRIGVIDFNIYKQVQIILATSNYSPKVEIKREWYY